MGSSQRSLKHRSNKRKGFCGAKSMNKGDGEGCGDDIKNVSEQGKDIVDNANPDTSMNASASSSKLGDLNTTMNTTTTCTEDDELLANPECTLFISSSVLFQMINVVGRCLRCLASVSVEHLLSEKRD